MKWCNDEVQVVLRAKGAQAEQEFKSSRQNVLIILYDLTFARFCEKSAKNSKNLAQ